MQVVKIDKDVIEICQAYEVQVFAEEVIYPSLEGSTRICQSEGHDHVLVKAILCPEGSFPFVAICDLHVVIGVPHVQFRINVVFGESVQ